MLKGRSFFKRKKSIFRGPPPLKRKFQMPEVKEIKKKEEDEKPVSDTEKETDEKNEP